MVDVPAETPGSSQTTGIATGAGAVLGAIILAPIAVAAADIWGLGRSNLNAI